jgi:hypothetical protein
MCEKDDVNALVAEALGAWRAGKLPLVVSPAGITTEFYDVFVEKTRSRSVVGVFTSAAHAERMADKVRTDAKAFPTLKVINAVTGVGNCTRGDRVKPLENQGLPRTAACLSCEDRQDCEYISDKEAACNADEQFMGVYRQKYVKAFKNKDFGIIHGDPSEVFKPVLDETVPKTELLEEIITLEELFRWAHDLARSDDDKLFFSCLIEQVCQALQRRLRDDTTGTGIMLRFRVPLLSRSPGLNWCQVIPPAAKCLAIDLEEFGGEPGRTHNPKLLGFISALPAIDAEYLEVCFEGDSAILTAAARLRSPPCPLVVCAPGCDPGALESISGCEVVVVGTEQAVERVDVRITRHTRPTILTSLIRGTIAKCVAEAERQGVSLRQVVVVVHRDQVVELGKRLGTGVQVVTPDQIEGVRADLLIVAGVPVAHKHVAAHLVQQGIKPVVDSPEWRDACSTLALSKVRETAARIGAIKVVVMTDERLDCPTMPSGKLDEESLAILKALGQAESVTDLEICNTCLQNCRDKKKEKEQEEEKEIEKDKDKRETGFPCNFAKTEPDDESRRSRPTVDQLAATTGLKAPTVRRRLALLEMDGFVLKTAGKPATYALTEEARHFWKRTADDARE